MGRASKAAAGGVTIEEQIRERVSAIPEPCAIAMGKAMTIGDMGLVEDIAFGDGHARITLCLTDAACRGFRSAAHGSGTWRARARANSSSAVAETTFATTSP